MPSIRSLALFSGVAAFASAFTTPTNATWGPLLTPNLSTPVVQGKSFMVTWDPAGHSTDGVTVSLVLCRGPSNNCVTGAAIAEGIPAAQKNYVWSVPCSLAPGEQGTDTGNGMLIIVDGTGEFQYSTQFSVLANSACGSSAVSGSTTSTGSTVTTKSTGTTLSTSSISIITPTTSFTIVDCSPATWCLTSTDSSTASISTATTSVSAAGITSAPSTSGAAVSTPTSGGGASTSHDTSFATASPASTSSAFTGAAARPTGAILGLVAAGGMAILAL